MISSTGALLALVPWQTEPHIVRYRYTYSGLLLFLHCYTHSCTAPRLQWLRLLLSRSDHSSNVYLSLATYPSVYRPLRTPVLNASVCNVWLRRRWWWLRSAQYRVCRSSSHRDLGFCIFTESVSRVVVRVASRKHH